LRFLPSRRRHRDPEYFEQLKSMIFPREVSYRVTGDESGPEQNRFEIAGGQAGPTRSSSTTHHHRALY
jgi:hypothetical protein